MYRKLAVQKIIRYLNRYGIWCLDDYPDYIIRKMLERLGYQVFEDTCYVTGCVAWFAALPEFDSDNWWIELPNGVKWLGGESKPDVEE